MYRTDFICYFFSLKIDFSEDLRIPNLLQGAGVGAENLITILALAKLRLLAAPAPQHWH